MATIKIASEHLKFVAKMNKFLDGEDAVIPTAEWVAQNGDKMQPIIAKYETLTFYWRREFWKLAKKRALDDCMKIICTIEELLRLSADGGYEFTTKNGLACIIKRLDQTGLVPKMVQAAEAARANHANADAAIYIETAYPREAYAFSYKIGEQTFGLIYHFIGSEGHFPIGMIRVFENARNSSPITTPSSCLRAVFVNEHVHHASSSNIKNVVAESIRKGTAPTITALFSRRCRVRP
jgi:hypothetical protein